MNRIHNCFSEITNNSKNKHMNQRNKFTVVESDSAASVIISL